MWFFRRQSRYENDGYGRRATDNVAAAVQRLDDHIEQCKVNQAKIEAALAQQDNERSEIRTELMGYLVIVSNRQIRMGAGIILMLVSALGWLIARDVFHMFPQ